MYMNKVRNSYYFYDDFALDENIGSEFPHGLTLIALDKSSTAQASNELEVY